LAALELSADGEEPEAVYPAAVGEAGCDAPVDAPLHALQHPLQRMVRELAQVVVAAAADSHPRVSVRRHFAAGERLSRSRGHRVEPLRRAGEQEGGETEGAEKDGVRAEISLLLQKIHRSFDNHLQ
jgi:hypothetical protein